MELGVFLFLSVFDFWLKLGCLFGAYKFISFTTYDYKNIKSKKDAAVFTLFWIVPFSWIGIILTERINQLIKWWKDLPPV